jgi:3-oxoacyl-[acyl-carrier-protein] synthase II
MRLEVREVVVTGLGTVGAFGEGLGALAGALGRGEPILTEVDRSGGFHLPRSARTAALATEVDLSHRVSRRDARRMSRPSRYAVAAARAALEKARVETGDEPDPSTAVNLATAYGPSLFTLLLLDQMIDDGPEGMSPFYFTECVANAAASQIAIQCRLSGPNVTICQREAGPLVAVARGASDIRAGRVRRALSGSAEEMPPVLHGHLDRFRALARPSGERGECARPFDAHRDGFLAAEGATVLVLEDAEVAREREARALARVAAWGGAFDPTASSVGWGDGAAVLAGALRQTLERFDIAIDGIDAIVSGASGSRAGDRLEARMLREIWTDVEMPPVLVPKAVTGEYGGAFVGGAIAALHGHPFGRVAALREPDPDLGVVPHDGSTLPGIRRVLVTCLAAGGASAWLVLECP